MKNTDSQKIKYIIKYCILQSDYNFRVNASFKEVRKFIVGIILWLTALTVWAVLQ